MTNPSVRTGGWGPPHPPRAHLMHYSFCPAQHKTKKDLPKEVFFGACPLVAGEVSKGFVSLGHLVGVFTLLDGVTGIVKGVQQLFGEQDVE